MKRDARLGLAVILVLGLALTMLVARSLNKRADQMEAEEESERATTQARRQEAERTRAQQLNLATTGASSASATQPSAGSEDSPESLAQREALARFSNDHARIIPQPNNPLQYPTDRHFPDGTSPSQNPYSGAEVSELSGDTHQDFAVERQQKLTGYNYKWQSGDTVAKVSEKVFGGPKYSNQIQSANPTTKWEQLKPGMKISIPVIKNAPPKLELEKIYTSVALPNENVAAPNARPLPVAHTAEAHSTTLEHAVTGGKSYTVQSGDTLAKIATNFYGSSGPKALKKLQDANPGLDPRKLKIGMNLKVPQ